MLRLLLLFFFTIGNNDLQTGIDLFNTRAQNAQGLKADPTTIAKAIKIFETLIAQGQNTERIGYYYLASLNFQGQFAVADNSEKKIIYKKATEAGNKFIKLYPKSAAIRFELITSIGLEAEINGVLKSAENGVVNQMLLHSQMLIQTDSMYYSCAGWKVLAILNYKTPNIPLIITWPSKDEAKRLLQKALKYYPTDISNNLYYAEALLSTNEKVTAKIYFQLVTRLPSRKEFYLEDESQKAIAQKYLADWK